MDSDWAGLRYSGDRAWQGLSNYTYMLVKRDFSQMPGVFLQ